MPPEASDPLPAPGGDEADEANVATHLLSMFSWWREIGLSAAAAAACALALFGGLALVAPRYHAEATVTMVPISSRVTDPTASGLSARQAELVGLVHHGGVARAVLARVGDLLDEEEREPRRLLNAVTAALINPEGRMKVSNLLSIGAIADDKRKAQVLANAWAEEYVRAVSERLRSGAMRAETIRVAAAAQRRDYEAAQRDVEAFLESNEIARLTRGIRHKRRTLNRLAGVRAEAVADAHGLRRTLRGLIEEAEGLLDQIRRSDSPPAASNALTIMLLKAQAFASSNPSPYGAEVVIADPGAAASDPAGQRADVEALVVSLRARYRRVEAVLAAWAKDEEGGDPVDAGLIEIADPASGGGESRVPIAEQMARLDEEVRDMEARREAAKAGQLELEKRRDREREALFALEDNLRKLEVDDASLYPDVHMASPAIVARRYGINPFLAAALAGGLGLFAAAGGALLLDSTGRRPPLALRARRKSARGV